jgi:antitoxin component HigA of HigAB toxin-antitoxin module
MKIRHTIPLVTTDGQLRVVLKEMEQILKKSPEPMTDEEMERLRILSLAMKNYDRSVYPSARTEK